MTDDPRWMPWRLLFEQELDKLSAGLEYDDMIPWIDAHLHYTKGWTPSATAKLGWDRMVNDRVPARESRHDIENEIEPGYARAIPTHAARAIE